MKRSYATQAGGSRSQRPYKKRRKQAPMAIRGGGPRTGGYLNRTGGYRRFAPFQELKFADQTVNTAIDPVATSQWIVSLNNGSGIAQGDGQSERIGRKAVISSVHMEGYLEMDPGSVISDSTNMVRIAVVLDKQANGSVPGFQDIWRLAGLSMNQFRNLEKSSRFKVLFDKRYVLRPQVAGNGTAVDVGQWLAPIKFHKRVNIPVEYSGITNSVSSIVNNNLLVFACRESAASEPRIVYNWRIRYDG